MNSYQIKKFINYVTNDNKLSENSITKYTNFLYLPLLGLFPFCCCVFSLIFLELMCPLMVKVKI